jgi:hypothetical protein
MGTVLHRTTRQLLTSINTPDYSAQDWIHNPYIAELTESESKYWVISNDTVRDMTSQEKDSEYLDEIKIAKCANIKTRTDELIAQGYSYSSKTFSLSLVARIELIGLHQLRSDPAITYPIKWNTLDESSVFNLTNSDDMHAFFLTAFGTYRSITDSGTSLKDQVRAASTIAEVNEIVDER